MATLGHVAVGMATGRLYAQPATCRRRLILAMVLLSVLALLPDADVVAFALGIPYDAEWGHRGAAHSFGFAAMVAAAAALIAWPLRLPPVRSAIAVFVAVGSHGLLDIFTDGGLGIASFWPLSNARHFAPWQPIPVAPIGLGFLSARGLTILSVEAVYFAPLFVIALWPRRRCAREGEP